MPHNEKTAYTRTNMGNSVEGQRFEATVHGLVQGVFFRHFTCLKAQELAITGSVTNQPDGSVFVTAEGSRENLDALLEWLNHGPDLARIDRVDVNWCQPLSAQTDFAILR